MSGFLKNLFFNTISSQSILVSVMTVS